MIYKGRHILCNFVVDVYGDPYETADFTVMFGYATSDRTSKNQLPVYRADQSGFVGEYDDFYNGEYISL